MRSILLIITILCNLSFANTLPNLDLQYRFNAIKKDKIQLAKFIHDMPIGGDLHNHLAGSASHDVMLHIATRGHYFICPGYVICSAHLGFSKQISRELKYKRTYKKIVSAWTMDKSERTRNESDHDHFFSTFLKFGPLIPKHRSEMLAAILKDAAREKVQYLELIIVSDDNKSARLADTISWHGDFAAYHRALLQAGMSNLTNSTQQYINRVELGARKILGCDKDSTQAVCRIPVRYHSTTLRSQEPNQVFAQLMLGFELVSKDPRFVAINIAQAEDGKVSMRDYHLHMQMIDFFHQQYPDVKISLHAGELTSDFVSKNELGNHINDAVFVGHANRIGHGVSIRDEVNLNKLILTMKQRDILVEINLSSNEEILHVNKTTHPLHWYLENNIPVALSTDDAGILLTDLNQEYMKAVTEFNIDYPTLRMMNRNSLQYSFLKGQGLWKNTHDEILVAECKNDKFDSNALSKSCQTFLENNEKAKLQWGFEKKLHQFELKYFG